MSPCPPSLGPSPAAHSAAALGSKAARPGSALQSLAPQAASLSHPGDPTQAQVVSLLKAVGLFAGNLRISPTQFLSADRTRLLTVFFFF